MKKICRYFNIVLVRVNVRLPVLFWLNLIAFGYVIYRVIETSRPRPPIHTPQKT